MHKGVNDVSISVMKTTVSVRLDIPSSVHATLKSRAAKLKIKFRDYVAQILEKAAK